MEEGRARPWGGGADRLPPSPPPLVPSSPQAARWGAWAAAPSRGAGAGTSAGGSSCRASTSTGWWWRTRFVGRGVGGRKERPGASPARPFAAAPSSRGLCLPAPVHGLPAPEGPDGLSAGALHRATQPAAGLELGLLRPLRFLPRALPPRLDRLPAARAGGCADLQADHAHHPARLSGELPVFAVGKGGPGGSKPRALLYVGRHLLFQGKGPLKPS